VISSKYVKLVYRNIFKLGKNNDNKKTKRWKNRIFLIILVSIIFYFSFQAIMPCQAEGIFHIDSVGNTEKDLDGDGYASFCFTVVTSISDIDEIKWYTKKDTEDEPNNEEKLFFTSKSIWHKAYTELPVGRHKIWVNYHRKRDDDNIVYTSEEVVVVAESVSTVESNESPEIKIGQPAA
jgi:hypothetical protein